MAVASISFDTGSAILPDIGELSYNGVTFSSLFYSKITGKYTPDSAKRTTKYVQYTLDAEGFVTLNDAIGDNTIDRIMGVLRAKLEQCAGTLIYTGRGFGESFSVNKPGGHFDVCWGPIPTVISFEPRGGLSAYVKWTCMFTLPEIQARRRGGRQGPGTGPVLEFTNETSVSYGEDWYSTISIKGTLEIPLTRPTQDTKTLTRTVDDFRLKFLGQISQDFDLTRFRVEERRFSISRDKRTLDYEFSLNELPPMGLPTGMPRCSGNYSVRPAKNTNSLVSTINWVSNLRVTYTVPPIFPRRLAYLHFAGLWQSRMGAAAFGVDATAIDEAQQAVQAAQAFFDTLAPGFLGGIAPVFGPFLPPITQAALQLLNDAKQKLEELMSLGRAWPFHFAVNEGLYDESKQITFEASWKLMTSLSNVLIASGIWVKSFMDKRNAWAASVRSLSGPQSWLLNKLDPAGQAIVDFGD